jgi:S-adenosylmethionine decarboxylase
MDHAGKHLLVDLYHCQFNLTHEEIRTKLADICRQIGATVLQEYSHLFNNGGSSGAIVLAESHCTWHYWIDEKYLALDIFTCGESNPEDAIDMILEMFVPWSYNAKMELRGKGYLEPAL